MARVELGRQVGRIAEHRKAHCPFRSLEIKVKENILFPFLVGRHQDDNILLLGCCTRVMFPKLLKLADHNSLKKNLANPKISEINSVYHKIEHLFSKIDNLCD